MKIRITQIRNLAKKACFQLALIGFAVIIGLTGTACKNGSTDGGGGVDTAVLTAKINEAKAEKDNTETAEHAYEVAAGKKYVSQAVMNALETAISAAEVVRDAAESQEAVDAAVTALTSALVTFRNAQGTGTNTLDTIALANMISDANNAKELTFVATSAADVPLGAYWVTQTVMDAFDAAIAAAQNALASATTQTAINQAFTALDSAMEDFYDAFQAGTKTSGFTSAQVNTQVTAAETLKTGVKTSANGNDVSPLEYWVTSSALTAFNNAINALKNASGQTAIDTAYLALISAIGNFSGARQHGTIPNKSDLEEGIDFANDQKNTVVTAATAAAAPWGSRWATQAQFNALNTAIENATAVLINNNATVNDVHAAEDALETAYEIFDDAVTKNGPGTQPIPVSFSALTQDGNNTDTNTTYLTLTFNMVIPGFDRSHVTLENVSGVDKGDIHGSGPSYTLNLGGFLASGNLRVRIEKEGYAFAPSYRDVQIYRHVPPPDIEGSVSIIGTPHVGTTLSVDTSDLKYTGDLIYRWTIEDGSILFGSESTLTVPAYIEQYIKVIVSSTGNSGNVESKAIGPIAYGPITDFTFTALENLIIGSASFGSGNHGTTSRSTVGELYDAVGGQAPYYYSLVAGTGDTDNGLFDIDGNFLTVASVALTVAKTYSVRVQIQDSFTAGPIQTFAKAVTFTVKYPPAPAPQASHAYAGGWTTSITGALPNSENDGARAVDWTSAAITLTYASLKDTVTAGTDVSGWFSPTVKGLTYTVAAINNAYSFTLKATGMPEEISSAEVTIRIPADALLDYNGNPSFTEALQVGGERISYYIDQAEENVCRIGSTNYTSLITAINAAPSAATTITITKNITQTSTIEIIDTKHITLVAETDGLTITSRVFNGTLFAVRGALFLGSGTAHEPRLIIESGFDRNGTAISLARNQVSIRRGVEIRNFSTAVDIFQPSGANPVASMSGGVIANCNTAVSIASSNSGATASFNFNGGIIYGSDGGLNANTYSIAAAGSFATFTDMTDGNAQYKSPDSNYFHFTRSFGTAP